MVSESSSLVVDCNECNCNLVEVYNEYVDCEDVWVKYVLLSIKKLEVLSSKEVSVGCCEVMSFDKGESWVYKDFC